MKKTTVVMIGILMLIVGIETGVADLMHGDKDNTGLYTYIDLTDNGVSDGEFALDVKTFEIFEPAPHPAGENSQTLKTSTTGLSYFDSVTGQEVVPSYNTAMLTIGGGDVTSWMEVTNDSFKGYLRGRIWGTSDKDGTLPDYALLTEDTNEDGIYAYSGNLTGALYTGLFGDSVFTSFFVDGLLVDLDEFFPTYDYDASGSIVVDNFAYGLPEPATMALLCFGGLALLRRRNRK
jgi:hypothetical protein